LLFNSYIYIFLFLPITFFVYFFLNSKRLTTASRGWLILASLFFYSWWNIIYLPLILISVSINYLLAISLIDYDELRKKYFSKKTILFVGLIFNIGLLVYFKYMDFFISNINSLTNTNIELLHLALPLAISFFTLQQIGFMVDAYEGLVKERNLVNYALFVTFFPQLIAGPIVHHKEMMPQFESIKNKVKNYENIVHGFFIFSIGLFKKVIIADTFAIWANNGYDSVNTLTLLEAWVTSLSYTFQMYFDFSGYMDMAIGSALLFNIKLPRNFNSPYKATGVIEYWSRWHITLTNFITTYIYSPILKSFKNITFHKAMYATVVAFLISGIWHGASWMFVFWGGLHGIGIAVNHYWKKYWSKKLNIKINKYIAWFITFNFVNITFIFFRSTDMNHAINVLKGLIGFNGIAFPNFLFLEKYGFLFLGIFKNIGANVYTFIWVFSGFVLVLFFKNALEQKDSLKINFKTAIFSGSLFVYAVLSMNKISEFLYFNF